MGRAKFIAAFIPLLCAGALVHVATVASASDPFVVVKEAEFVAQTHGQALLWREGNKSVLRTSSARDEDFQNLYLVHLTLDESVESISTFGEVRHFDRGGFAIIRSNEERVAGLSAKMHSQGLACGSVIRLHGDALVEASSVAPSPRISTDAKNERVEALVAQVDPSRLQSTVEALSAIHSRYHTSQTGIAVAQSLKERYEALRGNRSDVEIETFSHDNDTPQPSIVVRIRGRVAPDELVILGSHIDSVSGWGGSDRAPGSDDNASGTATNFEVFRVMMENNIVPERTIEIHGYAAEEVGLVGSQNMAKKYKAAKKNVVTMLQNDMNLFRKAGEVEKIWFIENNTDKALNAMLGKVVEHYLQIPWEVRSLWGGDSDHTSWRRQGYATVFPFESPYAYNKKIHTKDDTIESSGDFAQSAKFTKLSLGYALHFAGIAE